MRLFNQISKLSSGRHAAWRVLFGAVLVAAVLITPVWGQKNADLSRLVVIGDSLSAGDQNSSLLGTQQVHGYASLIAAQKGVDLPLPEMTYPGLPPVLQMVDPGPPPTVERVAFAVSTRVNPFVQPMNLAVPGASVHDALATVPVAPPSPLACFASLPASLQNCYAYSVLGIPGPARSQVEWAKELAPTTILVWIGNMDALSAALYGTTALLTPIPQFKADYTALLDELKTTGATLVVANIPDVTVTPYVVPAVTLAALLGVPLEVLGPVLGIAPEDYVTLDSIPAIIDILTEKAAPPLDGQWVITASEAAMIQSYINAYNAWIASEAARTGAALVDMNALMNRLKSKGHVVGGQRLTTEFLGGIFSLDGVHPTNTGYAIAANEFIKTMNQQFNADIPPVSIAQVMKLDPLVFPGAGHTSQALAKVKPGKAGAVRDTLGHGPGR